MVRVRLISTSNRNLQHYIGYEGYLSINKINKVFEFSFNQGTERLSIRSNIISMLGDSHHPRSKGIDIYSSHSVYTFKKLEKVGEDVYSGLH